ncbi:hypothetical protein [Emticicia sp.]|uniref:hypothetical protein n=1 Tax=Emticicia sp. TaxID=1930953 RepID=UPI0037533BCA
MIDFLKIEINSKSVADALRKHELLSFKNESDNETGELEKQRAKYKNLKFLIYNNDKTVIEGSIHKYHNAGIHNHNDFSFGQVVATIQDICKTFDFSPEIARLHGLEFGVNIRIGQDPSTVLNMIICYNNDSVNKMNISGGDGIISHQTNHVVKIYNKSLQYDQPEHILRVEDKIVRMRKIEHLSIETLNDLCNPNKVASLGKVLFEMFDSLIIHEPIRLSELSKPELKLYEQAGNPRFWEGLNRSQRSKKRTRYNAIIERFSTDKIKETIKQKVIAKWDELLKSGYQCTGISETPKSYECTGSIGCKRSHLSNKNTFENLTNRTFLKRVCLTCGKDISNQRKGSFFCSEKLFGKVAKKCRNKESNPRHNPKNNFVKKVHESFFKYHIVLPLFPNEEVFKPTPQQEEILINVKFNYQ